MNYFTKTSTNKIYKYLYMFYNLNTFNIKWYKLEVSVFELYII